MLAGSAGLSTSVARADEPPTTAHFERFGQTCMSAAEKQRLQADLASHPLPEKGIVRLLAFSDRMEMAVPDRRTEIACVLAQMPTDLRGHARIAASRGLAYLEAAREVDPERFAGRPIFVVGTDTTSLPAAQAGFVTIVLLRSSGQEPKDRRVELAVMPPASARPETPQVEPAASPKAPPAGSVKAPLAPASGSTAPIVIAAPAAASSTRALGWLAVAIGGAGAAVGGIFLGYAGYENASASRSFDRNEAAALRGEAHSYARTGGIAIGLGAALIVGGAIVLATNPAKGPTTGASPGIGLSATGLALRW
ncbi:MAG: hypothetical protein QM820_29645 [Minicystis sp.]